MKSSKKAVAKIAHARLLGLAIILRDCPPKEKVELLEQWEKTTFHVFGLCKNDARVRKSEYVGLAWKACNDPETNAAGILTTLRKLAARYDIEKAFIEKPNCYRRWEEELRYLLFRYEEHLAEQKGLSLNNAQWQCIWDDTASNSIEHILPQSNGSQEPLDPGQEGVFVHRLGNLMLLPPKDNSEAGDREPKAKVNVYHRSNLFIVDEVVKTIEAEKGWGIKQIEERERQLIKWIRREMG